ncbi:MAG: hypothetical protein ABL929_13205, partial [Ferruginibacter sp.]
METFNIGESIKELKTLLQEEIHFHNGNNVHQSEITNLISKINDFLLVDYESQREYIPDLLAVYEDTSDHIITLLILNFLNELDKLKTLPTSELDLDFWNNEFDIEQTSREFNALLEKNLKKGEGIRLSNDNSFDIDSITGGRYLRFIHSMLSYHTMQVNLNNDDFTAIIIQLWAARNIAIAINRKEIFYFLCSIFFDGLHYNQNYQFARDFAEECLICSYKDDAKEYGYYLCFKVFGGAASAVTALHYATVANIVFRKKNFISEYTLKNYYWESIKYFRNIQLIPFAISLFDTRPTHVNYSQYELNKFYNAYFSCLLFTKDKNMPDLVFSYINKSKEYIINTGEPEALPWLATLYNIKKNYTVDEYDEIQMNQYEELFKRIIRPINFQKIHSNLFGNIEELDIELRKCLLRLSYTRSQSDFVTDNKIAINLSHINILKSFQNENIIGYLLSMILQSDFSIVFKDKYVNKVMSISESYAAKEFEKEYYTPEFINTFIIENNYNILWLGTD